MKPRIFNMMKCKKHIANIVYSMLTVYLWIDRQWLFNGKVDGSAEYCIVLLCILSSFSCVVINPIKKIHDFWYENDNQAIVLKKKLAMILLAIYTGFTIIGYKALYSHLSVGGILMILIMGLWSCPILYLFIWLGKSLKCIVCSEIRKEYDKYFGWKCFLLLMAIWSILYMGTWPGAIPYDGNYEIDAAMGLAPFSSWQPYLHVFFVKFALEVFGHIAGFFLIQISFMAALLAGLMWSFYKYKHIKKSILYITSFLIALCPGIYTIPLILLRDPIFSISMAWLVHLLFVYDANKKRGFYIQLFFSLLLTATMRSNGIIPYLFTFVYLIVVGIKKDRKLLLTIFFTMILFLAINGPFAELLHVQKETKITFVSQTAMDAFMCVKHYKGNVPEEVEELMQDITLREDGWASGYNESSFDMSYDVTGVSSLKIIRLYIKTFLNNPHLVIWNRLSRCSALWEMFGHREGLVKRYFFVDYINEGSGYVHCYYPLQENYITPITKGIYRMGSDLGLDFLFYRTGIYVIFIVLQAITIPAEKKKRYLAALIPIGANFAAMLYGIGYHEGRFIYWLILCWLVLFLDELFSSDNRVKKDGSTSTAAV